MKIVIWLFIGILLVSSVLADNSVCKTTITNLAFSPQSPGANSIVTVSFKIDTQFTTGPSSTPLASSVHVNITNADGTLVSVGKLTPSTANIAPTQVMGEYYPATVSFTFKPTVEGAYTANVFGYPGLVSNCQGTITQNNTDSKSLPITIGIAVPGSASDILTSTGCNSAGFHWTGSKCCTNETTSYFEDSAIINPSIGGGCWAGKYIAYGETSMNGRVINYKGSFIPCEPATASLLILPTVNHSASITTACNSANVLLGATKVAGENAVCGSDGKWNIFTSSTANLGVSGVGWQSVWTTPPEGKKISGCCPQNQCWSGSACVEISSALKISGQGYKCTASKPQSSWAKTTVQSTWDRIEDGFCAQDTQCLLSPSGSSAKDGQTNLWFTSTPANQPKCINNGQYILDNYCDSGKWTSRTKLLAAQMISRAVKPFSIICGSPDMLLLPNATEIVRLTNTIKSPVVQGIRTFSAGNNICVLKSINETFIGATMNVPVSNAKSILGSFLPSGYCSVISSLPVIGTTCKNTGEFTVYFDDSINSTIIKLSPPSAPVGTLVNAIANYITSAFNSITLYTKTLKSTTANDYSIFDDPEAFNNLFISDSNNGKVMAYMEVNQTQFRTTYVGMKFENKDLKDNPCVLLFKSFDDISRCENQLNYKTNGYFILAAQSNKKTKLTDAWYDLTSKLRLL